MISRIVFLIITISSWVITSSLNPKLRDQKLFTRIKADHSGINFQNTIIEDRERNFLRYENFYNGAGVGFGDFNKDGLPDIFFAGNMVADQLYLNNGDLKFSEVTIAVGITDNGGWSTGITIADVNADGFDDIYVCRDLYDHQPHLRTNMLYINNGDAEGPGQVPTFTESAKAYGLDNNERSRHATFFDFDRDGDLDMFLVNQPPNPGPYSPLLLTDKKDLRYSARLFENKGNDTFKDISEQAGVLHAGFGLSVVASDFNKDDWPDLYVTNDFDAPDFLYMNNGDGTFTNTIDQAMKHITNNSMGVDAADINNDGWMDLVILDMVAEDNRRKKENMSGMDPRQFWEVVDDGGHYQYMYNTLQLNNGNNSFSEIGHLAGISNTDWSWTPLLADFDNDGFRDLLVTNGLKRDIRNIDSGKKFRSYADSLIKAELDRGKSFEEINLWDIVDLQKMLGLIASEKISNYVYKNNGHYQFEKKMKAWGLEEKTFSHGAAVADLDNDGDLDIVMNNVDTLAYIYRNNSEVTRAAHFLRIRLTGCQDNTACFGASARVEYGEKSQIAEITNVRGIYSTSEFVIHFGLGKTKKVDQLEIIWPNGESSVIEGLKADQTYEFSYPKLPKVQKEGEKIQPPFENITQSLGIQRKHTENKYDDFAREVLLPHKMSRLGPCLAVGDVNGDGREDFYVGGAVGQWGEIFVQNANGRFDSTGVFTQLSGEKMYEDLAAAFFDVDSDKDLDLYVGSGGNEYEAGNVFYNDRLYINDGKGNFKKAEAALPDIKESTGCILPADFDQDGDMDLFVGGRQVPGQYPTPASSYLLRNEGGKYVDVSQEFAPDFTKAGMVTDAIWTDFDQDGKVDLIVVGEWMPVSFFKNTGHGFVNANNDLNIRNTKGWWNSIEKADFDNDGDEDYVVGNLGLNYKYQTSLEEPFSVHYADFDKNGQKDIVLSYYNFNVQYPLRGLQCSSQQVPSLKEKFKTYQSFAVAPLVEVYDTESLEEALYYEVETFASIYIENKNNRFVIRRLPIEAQFSAVNDFIIKDFDSDGNLDMVLAGNHYAVEVETPRNDAGIGLLLKGDGNGLFTAIPVHQSGFFLPHDVKDLSYLSLSKNKGVILAATNDDYLQAIGYYERTDLK